MDDARVEPHPAHRSETDDAERTESDSAWARALDGPPINPRSELIYHDGKPLRSRH